MNIFVPNKIVLQTVIFPLLFISFNLSIITCQSTLNVQSKSSLDNIKTVSRKTVSSSTEKQNLIASQVDDDAINSAGCIVMDGICIAASDISAYEAIKALHTHLDDDKSGDIDLTESKGFLEDELNLTRGLEKRQKVFHHNNDQHISIQELWEIWLANEVHNWTVEQAVAWLHACVELGQYADVFYENAINGSVLPRLASNSEHYLSRILGITNPTHRSKISIKAMDIVLFGAPKGSLTKDIFIASLIGVIVVLLFKFNRMSRKNNRELRKMDQEMETLQEELSRFHQVKKLQDESGVVGSSHGEERGTDGEEGSPRDGEGDDTPDSPNLENPWDERGYLQTPSDIPDWDLPTVSDIPELDVRSKKELQMWLQLTYEKEKAILEAKVQVIRLQIEEARDMCDKMKPNRKNLFGALSFIHGKMDTKVQPINQARTAFSEIQQMDKEMMLRWRNVEHLLGFTITQNEGIEHLQFILEPMLQPHTPTNTAVGLASAGLERGAETPSSTMSRMSGAEDCVLRKRISHQREASIISDVSGDSITPNSPRFPLGSTRGSQRPSSLQTILSHSHTVASGLSNYGVEERPRSLSRETKIRKVSSVSLLGNRNGPVNGYSTDETESGCYTVGDSAIKVEENSPGTRSGQNTPPHFMASSGPLRGEGSRTASPSAEDFTTQRAFSDKVRTHPKKLEILGKSFSQDEKSTRKAPYQNIGKYSSESSLELDSSLSRGRASIAHGSPALTLPPIQSEDAESPKKSRKGLKTKLLNKLITKPK